MTSLKLAPTTVRRPRAHGPEARPSLGATPPCRHGCTPMGCWHPDCIVDQPREPESHVEQHADWQTDAFREIEDAFARFAGDPLDWD